MPTRKGINTAIEATISHKANAIIIRISIGRASLLIASLMDDKLLTSLV